MVETTTNVRPQAKPLRLWPGVIIAVLMVLAKFVVPFFKPEAATFGMLGGLVGALAIVVWWVFFSRALWSERLGAVGLMILAVVATSSPSATPCSSPDGTSSESGWRSCSCHRSPRVARRTASFYIVPTIGTRRTVSSGGKVGATVLDRGIAAPPNARNRPRQS